MTDYYMLCESGLSTLLATLTTYYAQSYQIMNGDESGLIVGGKYFARLHPGGFGPTTVASREVTIDWIIELKIYAQFTEMQSSWDDFRALRSAVINLILQYPSLNNVEGVDGVTISAEGPPIYIVDDPEVEGVDPTPIFIAQTFTVAVHQKFPINGGEYA